MYIDGIENLMSQTEAVESYFHVAYADDHVTVVVLKVKKSTESSIIGELISLIANETRGMLDLATRAAGCGINPDKSELVVPTKYTSSCDLAKDEFVWLGYSLKINSDCKLIFTDKKMMARFKKSLSMARGAFQYIKSIYVRWRIFKVYICPVIEWYLPVIMTKNKTAGSSLNSIESFQHQMLALVSGACSKCNSSQLCEIMAEMPVELKLGKLALRMKRYLDRDIFRLAYGNREQAAMTYRETRGGRVEHQIPWRGLRKWNFGDLIYKRAYYFEMDDNTRFFDKNHRDKIEFDKGKVRKWVRQTNRAIRIRARRRFLCPDF